MTRRGHKFAAVTHHVSVLDLRDEQVMPGLAEEAGNAGAGRAAGRRWVSR